MVIDFDQTAIIGAAMQGLALRNDVIQNNIANADTVGFKKSVVSFESSLQNAIDNAKKTGKLDISEVKSTVTTFKEHFSARLDGNNVDIDVEMAELYKNGMKYETLAAGVMNYYARINSVLSTIR